MRLKKCVRNSLKTTDELRKLSTTHVNREDKLQLRAHVYHSAKEIINALIWEPFFNYKFDQKTPDYERKTSEEYDSAATSD